MKNLQLARPIALAAIILTFLLINLGGHVHNTGSSLACPDWPLCYGQFMPPMEGGILFEHSHRLLGSLVGIFTLLTAFFIKKEHSQDKGLVQISYLAIAMVVVQGILGGITVIYKLPTLVSTTHLGLSIIFFCTLIYIHHRASKTRSYAGSKRIVFSVLIAVYLQIILGALIRHLGLGSSCGIGQENMLQCLGEWLPNNTQSFVHMLHRYFAVFVSLLVFALSIHLYKKNKTFLILALPLTVFAQVSLGLLVLSTGFTPFITTLHLGGAALMIGIIWKICLLVGPKEVT